MKTLYPLADHPHWPDWEALKLSHLSVDERMRTYRKLRAKFTGDKRCPRKGEWFLSGAIVEAYRAPNDLSTPYRIARLVLTETKTVTTILEVA